MQWCLPFRHCFLLVSCLVMTVLNVAATAIGQEPAASPVKPKAAPTEAERFAALEKSLTGATLVGNFTVTGQAKTDLNEERYELQSVRHLEGQLWHHFLNSQ